MKKTLIYWTLFSLTIGIVHAQDLIVSGRVIDKETKEGLPFATVGSLNTSFGSVTNRDGYFELALPKDYQEIPLKISFLGFESVEVLPSAFSKVMLIKLEPSTIQLNELVVRPLMPQHYIKRSVKKFPVNYSTEPFTSTAYYREKFTENGDFLNMTEGYFKSYTPNYLDTTENQYQLMLLRIADDISEVQFLKNQRDKKEKKKAQKEAKKAAKNGEEIKADSAEHDLDAGVLIANFGGPNEVLEADVLRDLDEFLDSTKFKKYKYQFENDINFDGRKVMVISFKSKGTYEHLKQKGKIYIDQSSDAIIAIDFSGDIVIPIIAQPILFALGFSFEDRYVNKKLRYQEIDGKWYPNTIQWDFEIGIKKRFMFKPNEFSVFAGEQIYNIDFIDFKEPVEIDENLRFDGDEEIDSQVHNTTNLDWAKINTLKVEAVTN